MKFAISFLFSVLFIQLSAQVEKTIVQNLRLKSEQLQINLDYPYEVFYCDNTHLKIVTNITLYNSQNQTLKTLVENGQYLLKLKPTGDAFELVDNTVREKAKVNENSIRDNVFYKIYLPHKMKDKLDLPIYSVADL